MSCIGSSWESWIYSRTILIKGNKKVSANFFFLFQSWWNISVIEESEKKNCLEKTFHSDFGNPSMIKEIRNFAPRSRQRLVVYTFPWRSSWEKIIACLELPACAYRGSRSSSSSTEIFPARGTPSNGRILVQQRTQVGKMSLLCDLGFISISAVFAY